ncbi:hypothetical protein BV898_04522 [Hypsibius exemplaris]|uniref:Uncharacterized protein n=1 Tax=Hypsibius exemplaris TaxID=2072580 RepID=A0A1W0X2S5_HYPEX|nr:hypothetical protein BV898_04522 [Hypsibius exemplaris]
MSAISVLVSGPQAPKASKLKERKVPWLSGPFSELATIYTHESFTSTTSITRTTHTTSIPSTTNTTSTTSTTRTTSTTSTLFEGRYPGRIIVNPDRPSTIRLDHPLSNSIVHQPNQPPSITRSQMLRHLKLNHLSSR